MREMENNESKELNQLMEINEELLRSKGKLLQEIIELKKQVAANAKNGELSARLLAQLDETNKKNEEVTSRFQAQLDAANKEIVNHLLNASVMSAEIEDLKNQVKTLTYEKDSVLAEMERLKHVKWYQKLLGKR